MTAHVTTRLARFPDDAQDIERLAWAYRDHLNALGGAVSAAIDRFYPLDSYGSLIAELPQKHARPKGAIVLAHRDSRVVGCGMVHPIGNSDAEIKRVFVEPSAQGFGVGEILSRALIEQARSDGYARVLLDTTRVSMAARRLYEKLGFTRRGPYAPMPEDLESAFVFYELRL